MQTEVTSPCCGVCRIDDKSELCTGCLRTLNEIAQWSSMNDQQKRVVIDACLERQARCSGGGME